MKQAILGPTLADLQRLAGGKRFTLASAFYSAPRLDAFAIDAKAADIMVRLDLRAIDAWVARSIAPDALLRFWKRHQRCDIAVYYSPTAHIKIYAGDSSFLIGSANLTVRGLSGTTDEILWRESRQTTRNAIESALKLYKAALFPLTLEELEAYVEKNIDIVTKLQKHAIKSPEDSLPDRLPRPKRMGTYQTFLKWLEREKGPAAIEVLARANGRGQLSGHIRMNFFGLRQFLLASPADARRLRLADSNSYELWRDQAMENALKIFVDREAADEGGLVVDTWRTYLPMRSGGKPKSGGGTSGNLNRMLPLMAQYLNL